MDKTSQQSPDREALRPSREAAIFLLCLGGGVLIMPLLLYVAGQPVLGPYANGGYLQLLGDILRALASGSLAFWLFILEPYLAVWMWRLCRWAWHLK